MLPVVNFQIAMSSRVVGAGSSVVRRLRGERVEGRLARPELVGRPDHEQRARSQGLEAAASRTRSSVVASTTTTLARV